MRAYEQEAHDAIRDSRMSSDPEYSEVCTQRALTYALLDVADLLEEIRDALTPPEITIQQTVRGAPDA